MEGLPGATVERFGAYDNGTGTGSDGGNEESGGFVLGDLYAARAAARHRAVAAQHSTPEWRRPVRRYG